MKFGANACRTTSGCRGSIPQPGNRTWLRLATPCRAPLIGCEVKRTVDWFDGLASNAGGTTLIRRSRVRIPSVARKNHRSSIWKSTGTPNVSPTLVDARRSMSERSKVSSFARMRSGIHHQLDSIPSPGGSLRHLGRSIPAHAWSHRVSEQTVWLPCCECW